MSAADEQPLKKKHHRNKRECSYHPMYISKLREKKDPDKYPLCSTTTALIKRTTARDYSLNYITFYGTKNKPPFACKSDFKAHVAAFDSPFCSLSGREACFSRVPDLHSDSRLTHDHDKIELTRDTVCMMPDDLLHEPAHSVAYDGVTDFLLAETPRRKGSALCVETS